jgi:EF-hand domain pair
MIKHRVLFAASAATLLLGARLACAQPGPPSFDAMDKNKDGSLSKDEVTAFFEERRAQGGGQGPGAGGPGGGGFDPAQVFARWDTNGDGKVTKEEFDARPRRGGGPPPGQ